MTQKRKTLFAIMVFTASVSFYFISFRADESSSYSNMLNIEKGNENPQARMEQEYLMLRDPVTKKIPENIRAKELKLSENISLQNNNVRGDKIQSENWITMGPTNVGGRTRAIQQDITDPQTFLAGGATGGVFKTTNGGNNWYRVTPTSIILGVTTIIQDTRPGKTNNWYFAGGEYTIPNSDFPNSASMGGAYYSGNGIYKSTDAGESWAVIPSTYILDKTNLSNFFQVVHRLAIDPSVMDETHLYAATINGLLKSTNGGSSWNIAIGAKSANSSLFTDIKIAKDGSKFATLSGITINFTESEYRGIYRSEDGENWLNITPEDFPSNNVRTVMDIYSRDPRISYFLSYTPGAGYADHSLYRFEKEDSSYKWQNLSEYIPHDTTAEGINYSSQSAYDMTIGIKPDDSNYVFLGGVNLYRSKHGFKSEENIDLIGGRTAQGIIEGTWVDHHSILFSNDNPNEMYISNDGGVKRTNDCTAENVTWQDKSDGYVTSQFYTVAINESIAGNGFVVGGLQDRDIKLTTKIGQNLPWQTLSIGDGSYCALSDDGHNLYISNQHTLILRNYSKSGLFNDIQQYRVDPNLSGNIQLWINPYILDPNDENIMYVASRAGIIRVNNLTEITNPQSNQYDLIPRVHGETRISALSISRDVPHELTYGTEDGKLFRLSNSSTSMEAAENITSELFPENSYISSIHTDPFDYSNITISFSNYNVLSVFHSTDAGQTWESISGNLEQYPDGSGSGPSVRWITSLKMDTVKIYFVATSSGLYSTDKLDGSNTRWQKEGRNVIGSAVVSMVKARDSDGLVVASTHGAGVFASVFESGVTSIADNQLQNEFKLSQNYPNPFNPSTTISYSVPKRSSVSLKVYDILGSEVAELVNGEKPAGNYEVNFDASKLSSGIYFYTLNAGNFSQTRKMLLVK